MKIFALILSLNISLLFFSGCGAKEDARFEPFRRIQNVKLGMTKEEVFNIMKDLPYRATADKGLDGKTKIYVIFLVDTPYLSTPPSCVIDKETNEVERVTYGENDYVIKGIKPNR